MIINLHSQPLKLIFLTFFILLLLSLITTPIKSSEKYIDPAIRNIIEKESMKYRDLIYQPQKKYEIMVCTKKPIFSEKYIAKTSTCYLYFKKVTVKDIIQLYNDNSVSSLLTPKKYKIALSNAIPFSSGNLSFNNSFPHNTFKVKQKSIDGENVKIAIIDTGIDDSNPWFDDATIIYKGLIYYDTTTSSCVEDISQYLDTHGHGTHVASIVHSIAPKAQLIILKPNTLTDPDIICAINKAISLNASIISMSLGGFANYTDCNTIYDPLCGVIKEKSKTTGTLFTISAGNDGSWPWHYFINKSTLSAQINYNKNAPENTDILIRWYNISERIKSIEVFYDNYTLMSLISYDGSTSQYVINYTEVSISGLFECNTNQCLLRIHFSYNGNNILRINTTGIEVDVYDKNYVLYYYYYRTTPVTYLNPANNSRTIATPAIAENVFTIGSASSYKYALSYSPGEVSSFSSRGNVRINSSYIIEKPSLVAPGEEIIAAGIGGIINETKSGTSMAAPFFAGVLALIKQILPTITYEEIYSNLSAITEANAYNLNTFTSRDKGFGLINITKTINALPLLVSYSQTYHLYYPSENQTLSYNISFDGIFRAKINNTSYYTLKNYTFYLYKNTTHLNASNYSFSTILEGEFINSPYNKTLYIIAYSNISVLEKNITWINATYANVTLAIKNYGFTTNCNITLFSSLLTTFTLKHNFSHHISLYYLNLSSPTNLSLECTNNIGDKIVQLNNLGNIETSIKYSNILSNITINITVHKWFSSDNISAYHINIDNNTYRSVINETNTTIELDPYLFLNNNTYHYTLEVKMELNTTQNITLVVENITLNMPLNVSTHIANTLNSTFIGINSTLNAKITLLENITNNATLLITLGNTSQQLTLYNHTQTINLSNTTSKITDRLKANLSIYLMRLNKSLLIYTHPYMIDTKPPTLLINSSYNIQKILLPLKINESNLHSALIHIYNTNITITTNTTLLEINNCSNTSATITLKDKANNTATQKYNVSCMLLNNTYYEYIDSLYTNTSSIPINITQYSKKTTTKAHPSATIEEIQENLTIIPENNTYTIIKLKFPIPQGFRFKEAYKYNTTPHNITHLAQINNSYVYLLLNISTDPIISITYYRTTSNSQTSSSSSTSSSYTTSSAISVSDQPTQQSKDEEIMLIINNKPLKFNISQTIKLNLSLIELHFKILKKGSMPIEIIENNKTIQINASDNLIALQSILIKIQKHYAMCMLNNKADICNTPLQISGTLNITLHQKEERFRTLKQNNVSKSINKTNLSIENKYENNIKRNAYALIIFLLAIVLIFLGSYMKIKK